MRPTLTLACAAAVLALAGCALPSTPNTDNGSGSGDQAAPTTPAATSPAQQLADIDGGTRTVDDYQAALDHLSAKCTQDPAKVAGIVYATQADLQKNGVNDETEYTVMQHLDQSIPASAGKMDCTSVAASYAVLRESK